MALPNGYVVALLRRPDAQGPGQSLPLILAETRSSREHIGFYITNFNGDIQPGVYPIRYSDRSIPGVAYLYTVDEAEANYYAETGTIVIEEVGDVVRLRIEDLVLVSRTPGITPIVVSGSAVTTEPVEVL